MVLQSAPKTINLSPNEEQMWLQQEQQKRRVQRLQQVRQREKKRAEEKRESWREEKRREQRDIETSEKLAKLVEARERLQQLKDCILVQVMRLSIDEIKEFAFHLVDTFDKDFVSLEKSLILGIFKEV